MPNCVTSLFLWLGPQFYPGAFPALHLRKDELVLVTKPTDRIFHDLLRGRLSVL